MDHLIRIIKLLFLISFVTHVVLIIGGIFVEYLGLVQYLGLALGVIMFYTIPPTMLLGAVWFALWLNRKSKSTRHPFLSNMLFTMLAMWVTLTVSWFTLFFIVEVNYQEAMEEAFGPAFQYSLGYWFICLIIYQVTKFIFGKRSVSS